MVDRLIIDESALAELGLHSETIYLVEYDMASELKISEDDKISKTKEELDGIRQKNDLARRFRNDLVYLLKFKVYATKHLESAWWINGEYLDTTIAQIEALKAEAKEKGFGDIDKRIKIVPVFTNQEGFQHYEDKKAEFVLEFLMEHIHYGQDAEEEGRISASTLWRMKEAVKICNILAEELKENSRYFELESTINLLDELTTKCDAMLLKEREDKKAEAKAGKQSK